MDSGATKQFPLDFTETGAAHTGHESIVTLLYSRSVVPYFREKTTEGEKVFGLRRGNNAIIEEMLREVKHNIGLGTIPGVNKLRRYKYSCY